VRKVIFVIKIHEELAVDNSAAIMCVESDKICSLSFQDTVSDFVIEKSQK
jgi:hypothetical protein